MEKISQKEIKYPKEIFRNEYDMSYSTAREYQIQVEKALKDIFGDDLVKSEWDSATYDGHTGNHRVVYAPRIDVVVGPFNSYIDLDIGIDRTAVMMNHPLVTKLKERTNIVWNRFSRCFLAIEIVFSGNLKHIAGDFLNSTATGAIGFVVAHKSIYKKVKRMGNYFNRLSYFERLHDKGLDNLIIFQDDDFFEFLWELKNPHLVMKKLIIKNRYQVKFIYFLIPRIFYVSVHSMSYKPYLNSKIINRIESYGFNITEVLSNNDVVFWATKYTSPSTAFVYEIVTSDYGQIKVMEILDIRVVLKYRGYGIGGKLLKIFEKIAQENKCKYLVITLGYDRLNEPIDKQKRFFIKHGFSVWKEPRAEFGGWVGKKMIK